MADKPGPEASGISKREVRHIETHARLRPRVIYEVVSLEGREEMERPATSLWWSGLAAGLSISFSLLAQAILYLHLPDTPWRPLLVGFGYSVGFVMVVLSRQQLFTESTITVVLPLLADFGPRNLMRSGRVWAIVLLANIAGTLLAAGFCSFMPVIAPDLRAAMVEVSRHALEYDWWTMLLRGVSSGFLIAAMVWLIPSAKGAEFQVVLLITYVIAIGNFTHIVAGSVEAFMLLLAGAWGVVHLAWGFMVPTLVGNVIGGTALFALISYAQVMEEM
jgi:formate-nitrite transporter family protein